MHQQDAESDGTMVAAAVAVNDLAAQGNLFKGIVIWLVTTRSVAQSKFFTHVTKTRANLTTYSRKPENYNAMAPLFLRLIS